MKPTVHKIRYGLATNSSSTHSLIIIPGGHGDADVDEHFGWDCFTLGSREQKTRYAAAQLRHAMLGCACEEVAHAVAEAWTGVKLDKDSYYADTVDHQSEWAMPRDWDGRVVDKQFFDDLLAFLQRDDLVVLGGNDNDGEHKIHGWSQTTHPLAATGEAFQIALARDQSEESSEGLVCRKDESGGYWTLFNRKTGKKVRLSFSEKGQAIEPTKAHAPELVDVKITNWCPFNCSWCYQDSTTKGEHADQAFLEHLAWAFGEMKVFEVAIGGGEPTLHPKFVEILSSFRRSGVVPNFTTKNLAWLHDHAKRQQILAQTGAFAYSVESSDDIKKLAALRDTYAIPSEQLNCQFVMGTGGTDFKYDFERAFAELLTVADMCRMRLTLLGFKTDGRGHTVTPVDYSAWPTVLKRVHDQRPYGLQIGIDTALASAYQGQLADLGAPKWCYEIQEGKFSMYVDAVEMTTARSSYGSDLVRHHIKSSAVPHIHRSYSSRDLGEEILEHFAKY